MSGHIPLPKFKSVHEVLRAADRITRTLTVNRRDMIHALMELDENIKAIEPKATVYYNNVLCGPFVNIGNCEESLQEALTRLDKLKALEFKRIGLSATRTELPADDVITSALSGVGVSVAAVAHALPVRDHYLAFISLELEQPHHEWSLLEAPVTLDARSVPTRLSLPMQVRSDLIVIGFEQRGNEIPNTITPAAEAAGRFWFAWRPEPTNASD